MNALRITHKDNVIGIIKLNDAKSLIVIYLQTLKIV